MTRVRLASGIGFLAAVFGVTLHTAPSVGQPPGDPLRKEANVPGAVRDRVMRLYRGEVQFSTDKAGFKKDLDQFAKSLVFPVTQKEYYLSMDDRPTKELKPAPIDRTLDFVIREAERYVFPSHADTKLSPNQLEYQRAFAESMDAALAELFALVEQPSAPPHLRLNAARMLAVACRSGSPVHAKMVVKYLDLEKTRPEVVLHAIKAAENLLAAADPFAPSTNPLKHTLSADDLVVLLRRLEAIVLNGKPIGEVKRPVPKPVAPPAEAAPPKDKAAPGDAKAKAADPKQPAAPPPPAAAKAPAPPAPPPPAGGGRLETASDPLSPEQESVVRYFRRQAVRAMAQYRFAVATAGQATVRPYFTLARVAVSDPAVYPAVWPDENAEAAIGLCRAVPIGGANPDVALYAAAVGVRNFINPKVIAATDPSLADKANRMTNWKVYAVRLREAFNTLIANPTNNAALRGVAAEARGLFDIVQADVATPLEKFDSENVGAAQVQNIRLGQWIQERTATLGAKALFVDDPTTKLPIGRQPNR